MKKFVNLIKNPLFHNFSLEELQTLFATINYAERTFPPQSYLQKQDEPLKGFGLLIHGRVQVIKEDILGNVNLLTELDAGDLFAEIFACLNFTLSPVSVIAIEKSTIIFIPTTILTTNAVPSSLIEKFTKNLLQIVAQKTLLLNKKLSLLSARTLREKIHAYLIEQAQVQKALTFTIRFSRRELADFLCVDRSSLSRELSKMQKVGLITFHKKTFTLSP